MSRVFFSENTAYLLNAKKVAQVSGRRQNSRGDEKLNQTRIFNVPYSLQKKPEMLERFIVWS